MLRWLRNLVLVLAFAPFLGGGDAWAGTVVLPVVEDSAPYAFVPNLPRFNSPTLYAFDTVQDGATHAFESYLWFDVTAADIPDGEVLTEALLVVTYGFDFTGFGETSTDPGMLECHRVLENWDQSTLNWTNRPAIEAAFDTIEGIEGFAALVCDATPIVMGWVHGTQSNHGFALTSPTERVMGMYASESDVDAALKPTLFLTTEVPEPGMGLALGFGVISLVLRKRGAGPGRVGEWV